MGFPTWISTPSGDSFPGATLVDDNLFKRSSEYTYHNISNTWCFGLFLWIVPCCSVFLFSQTWIFGVCFFGGSLESTAQLSSFSLRRNPYSRALGSQALGWWLQCTDHDAFGKSLITIFTNCTRRLGGWKPCIIINDDVDVDVVVVACCCKDAWCTIDEPCFLLRLFL